MIKNHHFWLNAAHHHLCAPESDLRPALRAYGIDPRRLSRFTRLALLGAFPLGGDHLYLASPFNSPATFLRNFRQLLEHNLPGPLDFMANLHNAAVFHVAQQLNCTGNSLFVAADEHSLWQPLWLALNTLLANPAHSVLVGWVYETPPGQTHEEGSIYWQITASPRDGALARISLTEKPSAPPHAPAAGFLSAVAAIQRQLPVQAPILLPHSGYPGHFSINLHPA